MNLSVGSGSEPRFGSAMPAVLLHGVTTRRFTIDLVGTGRVTAATFRPGGWVAFGGRLPGRGAVAPLGPALGLDAGRLLDAVLAEEDDDARAAVFDAALAPLAPDPPAAYRELLALLVFAAWALGGVVAVGVLVVAVVPVVEAGLRRRPVS